jgi:hypothetical protein
MIVGPNDSSIGLARTALMGCDFRARLQGH